MTSNDNADSYSSNAGELSTSITSVPSGPFRATRLWHSIVCHLHENVEIGKHRVKMKTYEQCFTAMHAVDITLKHLSHSDSYSSKAVNRHMAVKLCQLLQDRKVIESLKATKEELFEDSGNKLYRFTEDTITEEEESSDDVWQLRCDHNASKLSVDSGQFGERPAERDDRQTDVIDELLTLSRASWKRHSTDCLKRKLTPAKLFSKRISLPHLSPAKQAVSLSARQEAWRETALRQLLCLVDIPVLDGLLSQDEPTSYANLAFHTHDNSLLPYKTDDQWLSLTLDCLECIAKRPDLSLLSPHPGPSDKLYLFEWLASHYGSLGQPLWADRFSELHVALLNLLMQGRGETVLRAVQLSMLLLPAAVRQHIGRLLLFMQCAARPDSLQLSTTEKNSEVVDRVFTRALICSHVLTPHQASLLVCFMRTHAGEILQPPPDTESAVAAMLAGPVQTAGEAMTFCARVSEEEFVKQGVEETQCGLVALANAMLDNHKVALKEKKQWLKCFQKQYPDLYKKHFSKIL